MSSSPATSGSASPRPGGGGGGGGAGKATQAALYDQVFGGDGSDISDLSDSDEEQPPARLPFPPRPVPASPVAEHTGAVDEDDVDEDEDEDRDEDDVYVPGTVTSAPKIPKWKKKPPKDDGQDAEGDDQDADEVGRRKKTKKRMEKRTGTRTRAPEPVEEDEEEAPVYDAETRELTEGRWWMMTDMGQNVGWRWKKRLIISEKRQKSLEGRRRVMMMWM